MCFLDILALYRLKVNVTSRRCTSGLENKKSSEYVVFKYEIELAVARALSVLPGLHLIELVDVR